jgi:hypothetical protein
VGLRDPELAEIEAATGVMSQDIGDRSGSGHR